MAAVLVALVGPAPLAQADETSGQTVTATIYRPGQSPIQESVSIGTLEGDPNCQPYTGPNLEMYGPGGSQEPGQQVTAQAWSLGTVLGCLQPSPVYVSAVSSVMVSSASGTPQTGSGSQLSRQDLTTPSDFADNQESPLIYSSGTSVIYDRPWRGGSDDNAQDQVVLSPPASLSIDVFEGPALNVRAAASSTSVPAGRAVHFTSTVAPASGGPFSYSWSFGDGAQASTADPQTTFASPGRYEVTLLVTGAQGGGGGATIPITVTGGKPAPTGTGTKKQGGGTSHKHNAPGSGPKRSSGRTQSGHAGQGSSHQTGSTNTTPAHTSPTTAATGTQTTTTATTIQTTTATTTSSTTTTAAPSPAPRAPQHHAPSRAPRPARRSSPSAGSAAKGRLVTGRLISDVIPLSTAASPLVHNIPPATAPALRQSTSPSPLPGLAGGAAALALLGLGAWREFRGRRRWPTHGS